MEASVLIGTLLSPVVFILVEGIKLYAKLVGQQLSERAKVLLAILVAAALAVLAGIASGEIDLPGLVIALRLLPDDPVAAMWAVLGILNTVSAMVGTALSLATGAYALLKQRMMEAGVLSFRE